MSSVPVPHEEILYRRVLDNGTDVFRNDAGELEASHSAFNDPGRHPSVDLSSIADGLGGMTWTQEGDPPKDGIPKWEANGVLKLLTSDVRAKTVEGRVKVEKPEPNKPKELLVEHSMDVHRCPSKENKEEFLRENPAHAEIRPCPAWSRSTFEKRVRTALALLAKVGIPPQTLR